MGRRRRITANPSLFSLTWQMHIQFVIRILYMLDSLVDCGHQLLKNPKKYLQLSVTEASLLNLSFSVQSHLFLHFVEVCCPVYLNSLIFQQTIPYSCNDCQYEILWAFHVFKWPVVVSASIILLIFFFCFCVVFCYHLYELLVRVPGYSGLTLEGTLVTTK